MVVLLVNLSRNSSKAIFDKGMTREQHFLSPVIVTCHVFRLFSNVPLLAWLQNNNSHFHVMYARDYFMNIFSANLPNILRTHKYHTYNNVISVYRVYKTTISSGLFCYFLKTTHKYFFHQCPSLIFVT